MRNDKVHDTNEKPASCCSSTPDQFKSISMHSSLARLESIELSSYSLLSVPETAELMRFQNTRFAEPGIDPDEYSERCIRFDYLMLKAGERRPSAGALPDPYALELAILEEKVYRLHTAELLSHSERVRYDVMHAVLGDYNSRPLTVPLAIEWAYLNLKVSEVIGALEKLPREEAVRYSQLKILRDRDYVLALTIKEAGEIARTDVSLDQDGGIMKIAPDSYLRYRELKALKGSVLRCESPLGAEDAKQYAILDYKQLRVGWDSLTDEEQRDFNRLKSRMHDSTGMSEGRSSY